MFNCLAAEDIIANRKKIVLRFVDSDSLFCSVSVTWPTKLWRPWRTDTHFEIQNSNLLLCVRSLC